MFQYYRFLVVLILVLFFAVPVEAQKNSEKKKLEAKRRKLKKEIKKIKNYLDKTKKKERSLSHQVKDLNQKIETRESLINTISDEIQAIGIEIIENTSKMDSLQKELSVLKKDYSELIYQSYKNRSEESRLMFILSSDNFYQGYQRFQYMKQYTQYRKNQGDSIKSKAFNLRVMNDSLAILKTQKQELVDEKKYEQEQIALEKDKQEKLVKKYRKQKQKYIGQIRKKQRDERKLTQQIEAAIRNAIKKSSGKKKGGFALTPEAKVLAGKFASNKGKLPWPVKKGLVTVRFGTHADPMDPSLKISSSGVRIATVEGAEVKAVFDGKVMAIQKNPQTGVLYVMIQHGNYISVYANLQKVYVSTGDRVKTKEVIGVIHTNKVTGKTVLKFQIWKEATTLNPADWVYKM